MKMKITKIESLPYAIPFAGNFQTAHGQLKKRYGAIIKVQTDAGLTGLGEVAPLTEFGGGTFEQANQILATLLPSLVNIPLETAAPTLRQLLPVNRPGWQAVYFGLSLALLDLHSQQAGLSLSAWEDFPYHQPNVECVTVNATIGQASNQAAAQAAQTAVAQGFSCVKLKVGIAPNLDGEIERVALVRAAIGQAVKLRLDANAAWSVPQAIETLTELQQFDLELVEQPVAAIAGLAAVRRQVGVPIAADEAVVNRQAVEEIIAQNAADIIVIKPMLLGELRQIRKLIAHCYKNNLTCFVTTSIDSGVGIAAALHLAATLPEPRLACGLATAELLTTTLVKNPPRLAAGQMYLPQTPGLGVELDESDAAFINF